MPLTKKGNEIMSSMKQEYGETKGEQVFYASKNAGTISGVDNAAIRARILAKPVNCRADRNTYNNVDEINQATSK